MKMPLKIARSISVNETVMTGKQAAMANSPPNGLYHCPSNSYHGGHHPTSPLARDVAPSNEEILTAVVFRRKKNKSRSKSPSARHSAHITTDLSYKNSFIDITPTHCHDNSSVNKRSSYHEASPSRGNRNGYVVEASPSRSCHSFQSPVRSNQSPQRSIHSPRHRNQSPFRSISSSQSSHEFYSSPVHGCYSNQQGNRHSYVVGMSPVHSNGSPVHSNGSPSHSNYSPTHSNYSPVHSNCSRVHSNQSTPSHRKDKSKRHSCFEISPSHSDDFYNNPLSKYHDYAEISPSHQPKVSNNNNRHSYIETTSSQQQQRGRHSNRHSNANRHSYAEMSPSRGIYDNVDLSGVVLRKKPPPAEPKQEQRSSPIREIIRRFSLRYKKKKPEKTERKRPHSFVNSQEWTLARSVPDLKLGILGSIHSGKSALVHRYLTGSYMQEESPEGGRFKKEVVLDGQSYLLLIRDEGGPPEMQFTHWVDAVIFVFSLENETSFQAIYNFYAKMAHYRNTAEIPLILVGTQDSISESNPRVIDDTRARKLANDLKRCSYYETCATYGLNVERVFQDACQKIVQARMSSLTPNNSRPSTPNHSNVRAYYTQQGQNTLTAKPYDTHSTSSQSTTGSAGQLQTATPSNSSHSIQGHSPPFKDPSKEKDHKKKHKDHHDKGHHFAGSRDGAAHPQAIPVPVPTVPQLAPEIPPPPLEAPPHLYQQQQQQLQQQQMAAALQQFALDFRDHRDFRDYPTPTSTPVASRRNKSSKGVTKSNSFSQKGKQEEDNNKIKNGQMGSGRAIPLKQGYLYKKSTKPLNKEWKKKYVALSDDGKIIYHPSLHDYMDDVHGKEIVLARTTVKVPGMRPRGSRPAMPMTNPNHSSDMNNMNRNKKGNKENMMISTYEGQDEDASVVIPNASITPGGSPNAKDTPNVKKRHRRAKSGTNKNADDGNDSDGYEFLIVSLENKQWHFEAPSTDEREEWVTAIEQQILTSLQCNESSKAKNRSNSGVDPAAGSSIRQVKGNHVCADCDSNNPDWASLNLGALVCIECSGIHRNLGTHISRVRSLDLDEWPPDLVAVMTSIGNSMANTIWEANLKGRLKPAPNAPRDDKEQWIRAKYEQKEYLPPPPYLDVPLSQQLIDAVARQDIHNTILVLAYAKPEHVNAPYSKTDTRTALHIAAALGNVVLVQLLLWYGADVRALDHEGRNALWYAKSSRSNECVELLKSQGCPENPTIPRRRTSSQHPPGPPSIQQPPPPSLPPGSNEAFEKLPASVI